MYLNQTTFIMIYPYSYRTGLIGAGIIAVWTIIAYIVGVSLYSNFWVSSVISIGVLIYLIIALKNLRKQLGGFITFQQAFLNFVVMGLIVTVISQAINYLVLYVIDPSFGQAVTDAIIEKTIGFMEKFNTPDDAIEQAIIGMEDEFSNQSSFIGLLKNISKGVLFYAVVGVIVAAIIKRKPDIFAEAETLD